ncbi:MAG: hypothetical protein AB1725_10840 [Armatimonadota bacterium]
MIEKGLMLPRMTPRHELEAVVGTGEMPSVLAAAAPDVVGYLELKKHGDRAEPDEQIVSASDCPLLAKVRENRGETNGIPRPTPQVLREIERVRRLAELTRAAGHAVA